MGQVRISTRPSVAAVNCRRLLRVDDSSSGIVPLLLPPYLGELMPIKHVVAGTVATTLIALDAVAYGQGFPNKPIRIVTTSAGGSPDFIARAIAEGISAPLGQPVIVENRP